MCHYLIFVFQDSHSWFIDQAIESLHDLHNVAINHCKFHCQIHLRGCTQPGYYRHLSPTIYQDLFLLSCVQFSTINHCPSQVDGKGIPFGNLGMLISRIRMYTSNDIPCLASPRGRMYNYQLHGDWRRRLGRSPNLWTLGLVRFQRLAGYLFGWLVACRGWLVGSGWLAGWLIAVLLVDCCPSLSSEILLDPQIHWHMRIPMRQEDD